MESEKRVTVADSQKTLEDAGDVVDVEEKTIKVKNLWMEGDFPWIEGVTPDRGG